MNTEVAYQDPLVKKKDALDAVGNNRAKLGRMLGISRQYVKHWGEYIPAPHCYRVLQIFPHIQPVKANNEKPSNDDEQAA